jgi:hypothetical protein
MSLKKIIPVAAFSLLTSFALLSAQTGASAAQPAPRAPAKVAPKKSPDTLIVLARLTEIPGAFPPNDLYNYVFIMKYRVIKVLKGKYAKQEILVGHYNPLIPRRQIKDRMSALAAGDIVKFEKGARQRLVLVTPIERVWKDAVEDEYPDSDLDKYYALKAEIAR